MTTCPSCGAALPASALSASLGAARCTACRTLIDLDAPRALQPRPVPEAPKRWLVEAGPGSLLVRWRWFGPVFLFLVPFTLFWNAIMVGAAQSAGWYALLLPHVWVGVGLAYFCLALLINSSTVRVAEGMLHVRHGPLPWLGTRAIPVGELSQLFVVEKRGQKGSVRYELCGLGRDGKRQSIISGLPDADAARFLEARLEHVLSIVNQPVDGEMRR